MKGFPWIGTGKQFSSERDLSGFPKSIEDHFRPERFLGWEGDAYTVLT